MKNISHECNQCIYCTNKEKCLNCINQSNFEPMETEKHINKFFFGLFGILFAVILFLITTKLLMCKQPKEQVISIPADTTFTVTASVYHAVKEQCDSDPYTTAYMVTIDKSNPDKHRFVALSRDLLKVFKAGDTIQVNGTWTYDGLWIVADKMNARFTNSIDFLIAKGQYEHKFEGVVMKKYVNNQK